MIDPNPNELKFWIGALLFSLAGGAAKMANQARKRGKRPSMIMFVANLMISGFCGMLCWAGALQLGAGFYALGFIAGVAGWMGPDFIELCADRVEQLVKKYGSPEID